MSEELKQEEVVQEDEFLFPGGPKKAQVEEWKRQFPKVCLSAFEDGTTYIWRTVNRFQWKQLAAEMTNSDQHAFEENILGKIILFPPLDHLKIIALPAGVPTTIIEQFTRACGFGSAQLIEL